MVEDDESEVRELTSIKWIGDWLEGYFYDELEKIVEKDLPIYNEIAKYFGSNYDKELLSRESWSIREPKNGKSENICGKIFEKILQKENPEFSLFDKGVYTEKYNLEGKEYNVAVLSYFKNVNLVTSNIKLDSYSKLADSKYVKAGYTKQSGGYGIIVFYDGGKPLMTIQIMSDEPQIAVEKWLNYLSLILPSNEQKNDEGDNVKGFEIHPIEKLIEIWNSWFESEIQEIDLSDKVMWYSQFSDIFSCETCWPHLIDSVKMTMTSNVCCNRACLKILSSVGQSTNRAQQVIIAESTESDCGNLHGNSNFQTAINIIDTSLFVHKLPLLIGVHHYQRINGKWSDKCSRNTPSITNHYIVIIGKHYDREKKLYYYHFYEVGTSGADGVNTNNRLYIYSDEKLIKGNTAYIKNCTEDFYYTITEVRKNIGQTY